MATHYYTPIDQTPGRLQGNSRNGGDASAATKQYIEQRIVTIARLTFGLDNATISQVVAFAKVESGFNLDAEEIGGQSTGDRGTPYRSPFASQCHLHHPGGNGVAPGSYTRLQVPRDARRYFGGTASAWF